MECWNSVQCFAFIEDYHGGPHLWCSCGKDYKNQQKRNNILKQLFKRYSIDAKTILNKNQT